MVPDICWLWYFFASSHKIQQHIIIISVKLTDVNFLFCYKVNHNHNFLRSQTHLTFRPPSTKKVMLVECDDVAWLLGLKLKWHIV